MHTSALAESNHLMKGEILMAEAHSPSMISRFFLFLFRALFTVFAVMTTAFIFKNSLEIGAVSSAHSQQVTDFINHYITQIGLHPLTNFQVRKLAHFSEYALLGFWFMLCLRVYTSHYIRHISWPLLLVLGIANADETLQLFVANRAGMVTDVWIDFAGGCVGILAALILVMLLGSFFYLLGFGRHRR